MKSNLRKIYGAKEEFDILNNPSYHFMKNPIYQVNEFIISQGENLNKNFINNLKDLKIEKETTVGCSSNYDYVTNTLYCKDSKGDLFGLLHVASNDRNKKYTGLITNDEVGYGLNDGLTEVFSKEISYGYLSYPFEATIAKALYMIDPLKVTSCYFNNDSTELLSLNNNMKDLMRYLDNFHDNYVKLILLYKERFLKKLNKFKNSNQICELKEVEKDIYILENANFRDVYYIISILIDIINNSLLKEEEKQDLFIRLYNEFNYIFVGEDLFYLYELNQEVKKNILVKKKIK